MLYTFVIGRQHPSNDTFLVFLAIPHTCQLLSWHPFTHRIPQYFFLRELTTILTHRATVVGIFPNEADYVRLVTTYLMEYAEDWSVSRAYLSQQSIEEILLLAA